MRTLESYAVFILMIIAIPLVPIAYFVKWVRNMAKRYLEKEGLISGEE